MMRGINRPMPRLARRLFALIGAAVLGATLLVPSGAQAAQPLRFVPVELYCGITEDFHGPDGAYIRADGRVYWPWNGVVYMNKGSYHDFASRYAREFTTDIKLDLWDQDRGIWDDDDHLGTVWIDANDAGQGMIERWFASDGAYYRLKFYVERT
jgi:hypothetical protein